MPSKVISDSIIFTVSVRMPLLRPSGAKGNPSYSHEVIVGDNAKMSIVVLNAIFYT